MYVSQKLTYASATAACCVTVDAVDATVAVVVVTRFPFVDFESQEPSTPARRAASSTAANAPPGRVRQRPRLTTVRNNTPERVESARGPTDRTPGPATAPLSKSPPPGEEAPTTNRRDLNRQTAKGFASRGNPILLED